MTELGAEIERGWAAARRDDPEPTVAYFADLLARHPSRLDALQAHAEALDYAGHEAEAVPAYERVLAAGVAGDDLRRTLLQYGSTLRNLGRHDDAVAALRAADQQFPGDDTVRVFLALVLTGAGRCPEAVAGLVTLALDRIDSDDLRSYQWALRHYAAELAPPSSGGPS